MDSDNNKMLRILLILIVDTNTICTLFFAKNQFFIPIRFSLVAGKNEQYIDTTSELLWVSYTIFVRNPS